jgi:polyphosphate kinase
MTATPSAPPVVAPAPVDLAHPSLFLNRELSWLEFNRRVLNEAIDSRNPPLERLKFLGIFTSNLDEFFQIRVAGLKEQVSAGYAERSNDGMTPEAQLRAIRSVVRELQSRHGAGQRQLRPELALNGVHVLDLADVSSEDRINLDRYFQENVFPVLTPLAVDPAHPFPYISNLSLSIAVVLAGPDGEERFARVKVPKILSRWVPVGPPNHFVLLEQLIGAHLGDLFPGVPITGWHLFRITRNTDIEVDQDEAEDLLSVIQEEIRNRRFGFVTRIEVTPDMPNTIREVLLAEFTAEQEAGSAPLTAEDVYEVDGMLDSADLLTLPVQGLPELHDAPFQPVTPPRLAAKRNIFEVIREGDLLLHHPYDSFSATVERLIQAASDDPDVVAIKLTLYRTGSESTIPRLLAQAAERGKQVAVLVELQARFDEENNIVWAKRLEDVGAHVSYGVAGLKTHAKVLLVVRREGEAMRRYVHIGTGNYHPRTARLYTDFGLITCDPDLGADLSDLFNVLTGFADPPAYRKLIVAPRDMRRRYLEMIRRETAHAEAGRPARIVAKMNALVDQEIITALYEASRAGVRVDLVVRGICCLRPGIPGISDRIRVVSVIGRFLEHSRACYVLNGGDEEVYIGSADWMPRNLERRVEAATPIGDPGQRRAILDVMELMLEDNRQAWDLQPDGTYLQRRPREGEPEKGTHRRLIERAAG